MVDREPARAGQILAGKYQLIAELGAGGMGSVWRARHLTLEAEVAVKILDPAIAAQPQSLERFLREAKAAAQLRSPHVVQILDHGHADGLAFICQELLEGETLASRLAREGRLSPASTARVMEQLGRAVARAHDAGIVHRDLKPDNVFLVDDGTEVVAKVLDFGIAKRSAPALGDEATASVETAAGAMLGTPYYMSPEQLVSSGAVDERADLWALGVMAFECLCGQRPFTGATLGELVLNVCSRPAPIPSEHAPVPRGFDAWFARATAREPADRFGSVAELGTELAVALAAPAEPATSAPPTAALPSASARAASQRYLLQDDGEVKSIDEAKLVAKLRRNDLSGLELVRREDEAEWRALHETDLFRQQVPVRGDARDAARWRQLRTFGGHFAIWLVVCLVIDSSWPWWKLFWGLFVALHALRVLPTAVALVREGKLGLGRRAERGRAEPVEARPALELAPQEAAEGPSEAAPLATRLAEVRALVRAKGGAKEPALLEPLAELEVAVGALAVKQAELGRHVAPEHVEELTRLERQLGERLAEAEEGPDRESVREELAAVVERRRALDEAGRVLERLRSRERAAAHRLERLRVDLASADARMLRLPELSTRIDEIRFEAEALEEVEQALATRSRLAR